MIDLGTVRPGSTIRIPFSSFDKDDGSSITMTNFAVGDILAYKDGNTTERASTSGYTATTDFDSKTGKHLAIIDLADNTTAGFWASGSEYVIAIDAVTVDTVTTGGWIARFRIGYPSAVLDTTIATLASQTSFTLTVGPAEDDALNGMWAVIHDVASAVQFAKVLILDYTGSTKTVTLAAGGTFTAAAGDNFSVIDLAPLQPATTGRTVVVDSAGLIDANAVKVGPTGSGTAQTARDIGASVLLSNGTGTGQVKLASGYVAMTWADIAAPTTTVNLSGTTIKTATDVEADTANIQTRLPAALAGGFMVCRVEVISDDTIGSSAFSADAITASVLAADAVTEIQTGLATAASIAALNNITAASVWAVATRTLTEGTNIDGSTFTAIPWNAAWDAEVQSECADALAAYGASTYAGADTAGTTTLLSRITALRAGYLDNLSAGAVATAASIAALNNLSAAQVNAEVDTALLDVGLTTTITGRIDAAVSTRMATYSQPTGFLAATFPGTVASTTNITAASGVTISGTTTTLDALQTALNSAHGAGSWATATGFAVAGDIPTAAQNAAAWGASVVGNSRTRDMYLQGLVNRIAFAADGLTYTLYASDDTTELATGTATRLATSVGGLRSVDPA